MREPGYYWVKHNEFKGWEIGNYVEEIGIVNQLQLKYWELLGTDTHYVDRELKEIIERRIVQPGHCPQCNSDNNYSDEGGTWCCDCMQYIEDMKYKPFNA